MSHRKINKRTGGPTYAERLSSTIRALEARERELLQAELGVVQLRCKELVMVDIVKHQQVMAAVLQQGSLLEQGADGGATTSQPDDKHGAKAANDGNSIASASSYAHPASEACYQLHNSCGVLGACSHPVDPAFRPFAQLKGDSMVVQLFRSTTYAMLQKVLAMTKEDWMKYYRQLFPIITVLLHVISHATEEDRIQAEQHVQAMQPDHKQLRAQTAAQEPQSVPAAPAQQPVSPAATSTASPSDSYQLMSARLDSHVPGASIVQDIVVLDTLIHELQALMLLAGTFNPAPVYAACAVNLATGEQCNASPAVRRQVAARMMLTEQQAQQLAVSLAEFQRGTRLINTEGASVMQEAADGGVLLAVIAQQTTDHLKVEQQLKAEPNGPTIDSVSHQQSGTAQTAGNRDGDPGNDSSDPVADESTPEVIAEEEQGDLDNKLRRYMLARQLQHMSQNMMVINTLTTLQTAALVVASYPLGPIATAVVEAVQMYMNQEIGGSSGMLRPEKGLYWRHLQDMFDQRRLSQLQEQQRCWWRELAEHY